MDGFKISLFQEQHNTSFPRFRTLSEGQCHEIMDALFLKYGIDSSNPDQELMQKETFLENADATQHFDLLETLQRLDFNYGEEIYVNWGGFKQIDVFKIDDFHKYFYDIWFPSSDDIDLFDKGLNWFLSIRHDGIVSYLSAFQPG